MQGSLAGSVVIFDLDGTLVDTAGDLAASMNVALRAAGRAPVPAERVRHLVGHGARTLLRQGFAESGKAASEAELEDGLAIFLDHYMAHIAEQSRPFPGAIEAIGALSAAGAALAICTNKREAGARALIEALELAPRFAAIVGGDTAAAPKPDPRPVRYCLEKTGARRAVFVGDSDTDIKAARAAGVPCLAALFGYGPLELMDEAFGRFSAFDELPALAGRALGGA